MVEYLIKDTTLTGIANAIREKTGATSPIPVTDMAAQIAGITGGGGGSSEDVRYVTFMSEDGTVEYGRKAVATGDDCADPIARGVFGTPTKESTAQYNYAHAGWATAVGGALDANALKAVTEDRTVYANFASVLRYYTITYYDGDTVLKTEQVAYGSMPAAYFPEKDGYAFAGWDTEVVAVTGDASYYAQWDEQITFANASWATINEICEAGQAADYFAIGDTKNIVSTDGTNNYVLRIIGLNFDDKTDGSGKAGITMAITKPGNIAVADAIQWNSDNRTCVYYYQNGTYADSYCNLHHWIWKTFLPTLPSDFSAYLKPITKNTSGYTGDGVNATTYISKGITVFVPSAFELGATATHIYFSEPKVVYPGFANAADRVLKNSNGVAGEWWNRTGVMYGGATIVYENGAINSSLSANSGYINKTDTALVYPCFCI